MKKFRVTVDGKGFDVMVEMLDEHAGSARTPSPAAPAAPASAPTPVAAAPAPAPEPVPVAPPPTAASAGSVGSPLAGKIVSIDVKVGEAVAEGAQLVTLEAMKMNTFVYAPHAGRIAAVHASPGDAVEEGAPLVSVH